MDIGILLLRLILATILFAHATQKTFGWFQGNGLDQQAGIFASLGLRPGRPMVIMASSCELVAATCLVLGLLTPLGALVAVGTMTVAGLTMHLSAGKFWNVAGGGEYPYVLASAAATLGFAGAGRYSLDAVLEDTSSVFSTALTPNPWIGIAIVLIGVLSAIPFSVILRRNRKSGTAD